MDRIKRVAYYINIFYEKYKELPDQKMVDSFYNFIVYGENDEKGVITEIALLSDTPISDVDVHRGDIALDIILDYYKFVRYCHSDNVTEQPVLSMGSKTVSRQMETDILQILERQPFRETDLASFFSNEKNEEKVKNMIQQYCIFKTQSSEYVDLVEAFNFSNPSPLLDWLNRQREYTNNCDVLARIYNEAVDKHFSIDGEEDTISAEQYEKCRSEVASESLNYLTTKYSSSKDITGFLHYYISLIYAAILLKKEEELLTKQNEKALKTIEAKGARPENILRLFHNEEYFFMGIELVSQEYLDSKGTMFDVRYMFDKSKQIEILRMLDPSYEFDDPWIGVDVNNVEIKTSLVATMENILMHFKQRYPKDYQQRIYDFLIDDKSSGEGILFAHDIEDKNASEFKVSMIRFLARKFYSAKSFSEVIDLGMEDAYLYQALSYADKTTKNILNMFYQGGHRFIYAYFEELLENDIKYEKKLIRAVANRGRMTTMVTIDPLILIDKTVARALRDGQLLIILEDNGPMATKHYLQSLAEQNPKECALSISELLTEVYDVIKKQKEHDDTDVALMKYIEFNNWSVADYKEDLLRNENLLISLLSKYYLSAVDENYSVYSPKDESYKQVKQKLKVLDK